MGHRTGETNTQLLAQYVSSDHFRSDTDANALPVTQRVDEFARAVEKTSRQSALLNQAFRPEVLEDVRSAIKDVVRVRSPQSGLKDYLVLLRTPLRGSAEDAILLFRKHVPGASEREGLSKNIRSGKPARQVGEAVKLLRYPLPRLACWCELSDGNYEIALLEPAGSRLDVESIPTLPQLLDTARLLAHLAAKAHRADQDTPMLAAELTDALFESVRQRGRSFMIYQRSLFDDFVKDPRTVDNLVRSQKSLASL